MIKKLAMAAVCAIGLTAPAFAATIQVTDAEAEMETDGSTTDLFMTITNTGSTIDRLYAVRSKVAKVVAMSAISEKEEAMEAAGKEGTQTLVMEVNPGERLVLHEDGPHIELRDLKKALKDGDSFMVTLFFERAGPVKVEVQVEEQKKH